jgi:peroxiredoxin
MKQTALLVLLTLALAVSAGAGRFNSTLSVGDPAPDWKDLAGVDGKQHSLKDYSQAKYLVLVFTCNHCPCAVASEDRLIQLQRDYADRGVVVVALNVGLSTGDDLDKMSERAQSRQFNFAYLKDASQQTGRDYGASVTPQVFVLDGDRKIAYMGAIDNSVRDASAATKHYLRDALEALLDGKTPRVKETRQNGCAIEYQEPARGGSQ